MSTLPVLFRTTLVCLCWCSWASVNSADTALQCNLPQSRKLKFSVTSRRNLTGHWIAQVHFEHGGNQESGPWQVEVDHTTTTCENIETVVIEATARAPQTPSAPGYELIPGFGYYKFYKIGKTWQEAQNTCMKEGAHLIIPNSLDEFTAIKKIWDRNPSPYTDWRKNHVFMGVSDIAREGHFKTVLGETLNSTGYTIWGPNQPDGSINEDCIVLTVNTHLHDTACAAQVAFICERELF